MTSSATVDGRSARAARTRESVVNAVLALAGRGVVRPTAREIAEEARISVRSVYVHFEDLDDLFGAAAARHFESLTALLNPVDAALPVSARLDAALDQRIAIHEQHGAVRRAAEQWAPHSATLTTALRQGRETGRRDLERLFGHELRGRSDQDLAMAVISVLLSAESWDGLRAQGLSPDAAREVIAHGTRRMLEGP